MYTKSQLASIAKRENNNKRSYLVVNPLQGKHIPVAPLEALKLFQELGTIVKHQYQGEKLLLIGFAETATAIGAALAIQLNSYYIQTTREEIAEAEYLYFSEAHSHATEQKLVKQDIDSVIGEIDRIVFVEDEVTTGNTILNIVRVMEKQYAKKLIFSVASLLNGMNQEAETAYAQKGIQVHFLVKTSHAAYDSIASQKREEGTYYESNNKKVQLPCGVLKADSYINARRLTRGSQYKEACSQLWNQITLEKSFDTKESILVLGTEEFMYPGLFVGAKLEALGKAVKFHASTRSPIAVSQETSYPLHERYELRSFYDSERVTYLYELSKYDAVLIITDAKVEQSDGIDSLVNALQQCQNTKIEIVRWC